MLRDREREREREREVCVRACVYVCYYGAFLCICLFEKLARYKDYNFIIENFSFPTSMHASFYDISDNDHGMS